MPGKIFIDTNIIIYSLGPTSTKAHLAAPLFVDSPSISTQVLSETANVAYCHHRCKVNPPTTGKETHLAVIYSLPRGNYFSFQKPSKPVGKGLLKEKIVSF
jgi:hypothetical protein